MSKTRLERAGELEKEARLGAMERNFRVSGGAITLSIVILLIVGGAGFAVAHTPGASIGLVKQAYEDPAGHSVLRIQQPLCEEQILVLQQEAVPEEGDWVFVRGNERVLDERVVIEVEGARSLPLSHLSSMSQSVISRVKEWTAGNRELLFSSAGLILAILGGVVLRLGAGLVLGSFLGLFTWHGMVWAESRCMALAWTSHLEVVCIGVFMVGAIIGSGGHNIVSDSARRLFAGVSLAAGCLLLTSWHPLFCAPVAGFIGLRYPLAAPISMASVSIASGFGLLSL